MAAMTSGASVRAWVVMSAADSASSSRSRSPRTMVKWPSSSGTIRDSGRSQRLSSSSFIVWGAALRRSSMTRSDAADSWWASSTITRRASVRSPAVRLDAVEEGRQSIGVPAAVGLDPDGLVALLVGPGRLGDPAAHPERLAGPGGGDEQGQRPVDAVGPALATAGGEARRNGGAGVRRSRPVRGRARHPGRTGGSSGVGRSWRCGGWQVSWAGPSPVHPARNAPKLPRASSPSEPGPSRPSGSRRRAVRRAAAPSAVLGRG